MVNLPFCGVVIGSRRDSTVFMEKLNYLRDNAEVFLRMLNEMRRRLKELRPDTPTAQNYRSGLDEPAT